MNVHERLVSVRLIEIPARFQAAGLSFRRTALGANLVKPHGWMIYRPSAPPDFPLFRKIENSQRNHASFEFFEIIANLTAFFAAPGHRCSCIPIQCRRKYNLISLRLLVTRLLRGNGTWFSLQGKSRLETYDARRLKFIQTIVRRARLAEVSLLDPSSRERGI